MAPKIQAEMVNLVMSQGYHALQRIRSSSKVCNQDLQLINAVLERLDADKERVTKRTVHYLTYECTAESPSSSSKQRGGATPDRDLILFILMMGLLNLCSILGIAAVHYIIDRMVMCRTMNDYLKSVVGQLVGAIATMRHHTSMCESRANAASTAKSVIDTAIVLTVAKLNMDNIPAILSRLFPEFPRLARTTGERGRRGRSDDDDE